jgi:uncharacterized membrane protein
MDDNAMLYTAIYDDVDDAVADLGTLEDLHEDDVIGKYDAAVIANEGGKPKIVKRVDRPRIDVIPELLGGGTLKRRELHEAAAELDPGEGALVVVGEPTLEKAFDKAVKGAAKIAKDSFDESADDLANAMIAAAKS